MRFTLALLSVVFAMFALMTPHKAHASGELVSGLYYLDDYPSAPLSPKLGLKLTSSPKSILPDGMSLVSYIGGGYIEQQADVNGNVPTGMYGDWIEDLHYKLSDAMDVHGGGGVAFNKSVYKSFDDYVHIGLNYKLW
jgi:hypothetical protein